jgi:hypothetical protein
MSGIASAVSKNAPILAREKNFASQIPLPPETRVQLDPALELGLRIDQK